MSRVFAFIVFVFAMLVASRAEAACTGDAVVLLIDRSTSMLPFLDAAKVAAKRVVSKIGKDDCLEIVAFDTSPTRVVKVGPGVDRAVVGKAIDGIALGKGTEIFSALDFARAELVNEKSAKRKVVLLVTDGQAPHSGIRDLVENMAVENIRISTIGVGGGIDEALLRAIADKANGHLRKVGAGDLARNLEEELVALRR